MATTRPMVAPKSIDRLLPLAFFFLFIIIDDDDDDFDVVIVVAVEEEEDAPPCITTAAVSVSASNASVNSVLSVVILVVGRCPDDTDEVVVDIALFDLAAAVAAAAFDVDNDATSYAGETSSPRSLRMGKLFVSALKDAGGDDDVVVDVVDDDMDKICVVISLILVASFCTSIDRC
jgi:hypothetical protein